ncbi:MAG: chitobiase/beta-hexosaminidase C-terminal domain-containing protein [Oscillospiraceae bacterium]|nr:chitobiase/beta-hexosaminidase C-terminal domain-containing protein [Oscillospiraceae bacterium]
MKLKSSVKWAIAAAATVTTVTVSVGMIANAYTYNWDETSGGGYGIFGNDKIEEEYFREGYDFEFSEENSALKQAVRFELSVDIEDYYSNKIFCNIPAKATIIFGGYDENGDRVEIGQLVKNEAYSGDLEYSFTDADKDRMASGKFWMDLEDQSYSSIEFKSIKFYDKDDRCILYGCAQDTDLNEENYKWYGQWTFYQLKGPRPIISGIQNADGTYALNAEVTSGGLAMSVETSNNAKSDICEFELSNAVQIFTMNGADVTGKQQLAFNSAEGANNEYSFVTNASVVLKDTRNLDADGKPTEIELYSVSNEQTVTIGKLKIEAGEPQLLGELPTLSYGDYNSADELLEALNNATRDKNSDAPNVEDAFVDSSVTDDTALFSRVLIPSADGSRKVIAKVVYDEVSGFDPASHKAQTITLKAHAEANDIEFVNGTVTFEKEMNCSADYIDSVKISKQPKTDYGYREDLDLSGGELTITYDSGNTEAVPMTDARVSADGFYGANGEFPAYNSEVKVTVTYTAEDGVYDPARADGARFSVDFTAKIKDIPALDAPVITPNGGTFSKSCEVSITAQEGASIFYTTDGTVPTADSSRYTAPFTITNSAVVKAIAVKEGYSNSKISCAAFTREISALDAPVITPNGGTFSKSCEVSITAQEGASIFYTTDGTDPTADSSRYTAPFTITNSTVVKAIAVKEGYSNSKIATAEFTKRSGGGSGSGGSGGSRPTASTEPDDPTIGGSSKSWSDIAADLAKLAEGSEVTIQLNGNTTVPFVVIKEIDDKYLKVHFIADSSHGWFVDGAKITAPAAADLSFIRTASQKHDGLRGIEGTQFRINNTGVPAGLEIAFKSEHAGKFANLYKSVDGKLVFVTCAKLGADGKVLLPNVTEKSDYIAMLCAFSDLPGDMSNDGVLNAADASAILKDIVSPGSGVNPLMADFNGDGNVNAIDASAILKRIVGLI